MLIPRPAPNTRRRVVAGATAFALGATVLTAALPAPALAAATGLSIASAELGNVFSGDEEPRFTFRSAAPTASWTVTDLTGRVVREGESASAADSGSFAVPDLDRGWYHLTVAAADQTAATTFAVLAEPAPTADRRDDRFGTATHYGASWGIDSLPLIAEAGIGGLRDEMYWGAVETTQGEYDWAGMRGKFFDAVEDSGVAPLLIAGYGNNFYDGGNGPVSAEAVDAYTDYAVSMADEFGDVAAGIEIWNEWDIGLGGNTNTDAEHYVNLLKSAAPAIKAEHPDLPVIGPAVALLNEPWFEETMKLGALDYLDGVVLHAYSYPGGAENLDATLARVDGLIRTYNDGEPLPMWITEHGWPTGTGARAVDERTQAANLAKSAIIATARDVEKYYVYDFMNDGVEDSETEHNFGLVHHADDELGAFTPKPGYVAYSVAAGMLADARDPVRRSAVADLWDYEFTTDDGGLRTLWSTVPQVVELPADGVITVTDVGGATRSVDAGAGGIVVVDARQDPVYLSGDLGDAVATQHSLALDAGVVGRPVTGTWTVDNSRADAARSFQLTVEGEVFTVEAPAGEIVTSAVSLPAATVSGSFEVQGTLALAGSEPRDLGALTGTASIASAVRVSGAHAIDADGASVLRLTVANDSDAVDTVESLEWTVADQSGTALTDVALPAEGQVSADVPLGVLAGPAEWTATVSLASGSVLTTGGTAAPLDVAAATAAPFARIDIDGLIDAPQDHAIDLAADGVDNTIGSTGPEDLSGRVWLTWDEDAVTLSADITDDIHAQSATGGNIWRGDSIQFSLAAGAPGEAEAWSEFGVALTPEGPQVHRWLSEADPLGAVEGAVAEVVRDDDAHRTVYEVAIPWARLGGFDPSLGLMSASVLVNEADEAGRAGFIEWGGGISGVKDSGLFQAVRLLPEPEPDTVRPEVVLVSPSSGGSYRQLSVRIEASDDRGLERVVANVYRDGRLVRSTQSTLGGELTGVHEATVDLLEGDYVLRYNALDRAGNVSRTATAPFTIDTTAPTVTVKTGDEFTRGDPDAYEQVSFKLYDAGGIDRLFLNGVEKDLVDNSWSDLNAVRVGAFGAVAGANTLVVHDAAGNTRSVDFVLAE